VVLSFFFLFFKKKKKKKKKRFTLFPPTNNMVSTHTKKVRSPFRGTPEWAFTCLRYKWSWR